MDDDKNNTNDDFEQCLVEYFDKLSKRQVSLGKEFEEILYKNIHELFATDI